jgi:RimJ/RimL family protein N-acetyltransferase
VTVIETGRLVLRRLSPDHAAFILGLLNEPSFIKFVGDKGVRTIDDARAYIENGPVASYGRFGFGLYLVELKGRGHEDSIPIGICGLVKRDGLEDPDIGFAFLPPYWSKGYAVEAAAAVLAYGRTTLGLPRIVAIANPGNVASMRVLEKIGLRFDKMVRLSSDGASLQLWGSDEY